MTLAGDRPPHAFKPTLTLNPKKNSHTRRCLVAAGLRKLPLSLCTAAAPKHHCTSHIDTCRVDGLAEQTPTQVRSVLAYVLLAESGKACSALRQPEGATCQVLLRDCGSSSADMCCLLKSLPTHQDCLLTKVGPAGMTAFCCAVLQGTYEENGKCLTCPLGSTSTAGSSGADSCNLCKPGFGECGTQCWWQVVVVVVRRFPKWVGRMRVPPGAGFCCKGCCSMVFGVHMYAIVMTADHCDLLACKFAGPAFGGCLWGGYCLLVAHLFIDVAACMQSKSDNNTEPGRREAVFAYVVLHEPPLWLKRCTHTEADRSIKTAGKAFCS